MKIAITGGTGLVGTRLVEKLSQQNDQIVLLVRNLEGAKKIFSEPKFANVTLVDYPESPTWEEVINGCDGIVNLAGEPIAEGRWTTERKKSILDSRQVITRKLVETVAKMNPKPEVFLSGSAIGYYGSSETTEFSETSPPGNDFLADVCIAWEGEASKVQALGVRLVILRTGIVLANGGAIAKLIPPFKLFAGGPIGSGRQWFSWIHRDDLVNLIITALKRPEMNGVYNATAPNPVRMAEFCYTLGQVMNRPSWLPVPAAALELLLGDAASVVLEGQQVLPKAAEAIGFTYQYPTVAEALREILNS